MKHTLLYLFSAMLLFAACKKDDDDEQIVEELPNPFIIEDGGRPWVVAHRGGANIGPENTIPAFDKAMELNVDMLELDVVLTKDSVLVVIHDLTIDRTSDGSGNVSDYTFEELQQFNFAHNYRDASGNFPYRDNPVRIPRLEEIYERYPDIYMIVEPKDIEGRGQLAADILQRATVQANMNEKVIAFSFLDFVVQRYRTQMGRRNHFTGLAVVEGIAFLLAVLTGNDAGVTAMPDIFSIPDFPPLREQEILDAIRRQDAAVYFWTVNDREDLEALIDLKVDGIITDSPDLMIEILREKGFDF